MRFKNHLRKREGKTSLFYKNTQGHSVSYLRNCLDGAVWCICSTLLPDNVLEWKAVSKIVSSLILHYLPVLPNN